MVGAWNCVDVQSLEEKEVVAEVSHKLPLKTCSLENLLRISNELINQTTKDSDTKIFFIDFLEILRFLTGWVHPYAPSERPPPATAIFTL